MVFLINSIICAISEALDGEFGDDYTIYTNQVEQGLKEPCFFISSLNPSIVQIVGARYFRQHLFCIQYLPSTKEINEECNDVQERLYNCLEYIAVGDDLIRGTNMQGEMTDGALHFFVNYNMFIRRVNLSEENDKMIHVQYRLGG